MDNYIANFETISYEDYLLAKFEAEWAAENLEEVEPDYIPEEN